MFRVRVRRTKQNLSFASGNYSSLYTANCPTARMCKFANGRDTDIFEVDLMEIKAKLLRFESGTLSWRQEIVAG